MIDIIYKSRRLSSILGEPSYNSGQLYKSSIFNFIVQLEDGCLVCNTLMRVFVSVKGDVWEKIMDSVLSSKPVSTPDVEVLVKLRLLVPTDMDELKLYRELHSMILAIENNKQGIERYNILTTTGCNARCFYCYEDGLPIHTMTLSDADKVSAYILRTYNKKAPIYIRWFGGEPLVNSRVMDAISTTLSEHGVPFYSTMSTNGLLIDNKILNKAINLWRMNKIRISMDGFAEEHNRRKAYINSHIDGFQVTLANIERVVNSPITMTIRLNIDSNNIDSIRKLIDYFVDKYKGRNNFNMYVRCLIDEISLDRVKNEPTHVSHMLSVKKELEDYIRSQGMFDLDKLPLFGFRAYYCAGNNPNKVTILPNGLLCSCECFCYDYSHWGTVSEGITNKREFKRWIKGVELKKCEGCCFLPGCTPFIGKCPMRNYDCKVKSANLLTDYMTENYRRYCAGEPIIEKLVYSDYDY